MIGRLGGDEFGLLLPETGKDQALKCGRKIVDILKEQKPPVNVSIGVALADGFAAEENSLISRADAAMYQAKSRGGSQVIVH